MLTWKDLGLFEDFEGSLVSMVILAGPSDNISLSFHTTADPSPRTKVTLSRMSFRVFSSVVSFLSAKDCTKFDMSP
jgi:hypothetical protein